jgi:hypothetical protein
MALSLADLDAALAAAGVHLHDFHRVAGLEGAWAEVREACPDTGTDAYRLTIASYLFTEQYVADTLRRLILREAESRATTSTS